MSWGTPTSAGTAVQTGTAAHSLSMSSLTIPAGTFVVVLGGMRASANGDAVVVSDSVNGTTGWTVLSHYKAGGTAVAFIAYSLMPSGLSSGSITVSDTSTGATNFFSCGFGVFTTTGGASSSIEDTAATTGHDGTATTTPTITSGTPANSGDLFFVVYHSNSSNTGTYTEDAAWTNLLNKLGNSGANQIMISAAYLVNAGSGTETHTPTTTNQTYTQEITAFKLAGGTVNNQTVSISTTPVPAISRQTGKIVSGNTTPVPAISRQTGKIVSGNTTPVPGIVRAVSKTISITETPVPSIVRSTSKPLAIDTTPEPAIIRSTAKTLDVDTTPVPSIREQPSVRQVISVDTTPVPGIITVFIPAGSTPPLPPHRGILIAGKMTHRNE